MPVKILAFDLDYTLLNSKKVIPPENIEALRYANERGAYIVPATGRIYRGIPDELRFLPFMRYFITANGSYIYDAVEDRAPARAEIPLQEALDFFSFCDTIDALYDCYQDNWGFMTGDMLRIAPDIIPDPGVRRLIQTLRTPVPELKAYLRGKGTDVQKLQLYFTDMELRARMLEELPQRFPNLAFSSSMPFNIEVNAPTATKGHALLALAAHLGLDREQVMAFGDGLNDISMIESAGVGVAMGNAVEAMRNVADRITATNDEDGVAAVIEALL